MRVLLQPYADWDAGRILSYFRNRTNIRYFPVIADPEEVTLEKMDAIVDNRFEFNGEMHLLPPDFDWTINPSGDTEWLILLHKFYYAAGLGAAYRETHDARYAHKWMHLTDGWIKSAPIEFLSSDVTGRRIQNWIHAHYYFVTSCPASPVDPEFYTRFLTSLHAQVAWLRDHLSPARNHRTLELTAIFMAAVVFPEMRDAGEWLKLAITGLLENMRSDLLPDGVQCELSTDYHHIVLRNYLVVRRLAAMNDILLPDQMDTSIRRALEFSKWAHRPDGTIPSLSDGDSGSFLDLLVEGYDLFHDPEMLYVASSGRQGRPPAERLRRFSASGYYFLRSGWGACDESYGAERYLVFDCGPVGAGNHGHLDLLHFEAYAYGRPLIVDPGRYTYREDSHLNWRALFRGTNYHNTVTVDGRNQTRYEFDKKRFKIRGPEPIRNVDSFTTDGEIDCIKASCSSHEYDAVHERRIIFVRGEYWIVSDLLSARESHDYDLWFHLSPDAQDSLAIHPYSVNAPSIAIAQARGSDASLTIEPGFVSPKYGVKYSAPIVRFHQRASNAVFHTVLFPCRSLAPRVRLDSRGEELRVTVHTGEQTVFDTVKFEKSGRVSYSRQIMLRQAETETDVLTTR